MSNASRLASLVLITAVGVVACASGDDASVVTVGDDTTPPTESSPPESAEPPDSTEPDVVGPESGLFPVELPGIVTLEGDPGPDGAGRPTMAWEPVPGAAEYLVVVHVDDQPHWGVATTETTATVGGATLHPDATGPRCRSGNDLVRVGVRR